MIRIDIEVPESPQPELLQPLQFIQGCLKNDPTVLEIADGVYTALGNLRDQ